MKLTEKKSEVILYHLTRSDITEISGILGASRKYVELVLKGQREYNTLKAQEIVRVALRRARMNQSFRTQKAA